MDLSQPPHQGPHICERSSSTHGQIAVHTNPPSPPTHTDSRDSWRTSHYPLTRHGRTYRKRQRRFHGHHFEMRLLHIPGSLTFSHFHTISQEFSKPVSDHDGSCGAQGTYMCVRASFPPYTHESSLRSVEKSEAKKATHCRSGGPSCG